MPVGQMVLSITDEIRDPCRAGCMLSERLSCLRILSSEDMLCSLSGFWHTKWNISGFTVARLCHNQHFAQCTEQQKLQLDLPPRHLNSAAEMR